MRSGIKSLIISLIMIFNAFNIPAFASDFGFSYEFNSENEVQSWSGGIFDESCGYGESGGIYINNPFGEVKNSLVTHVLDYREKIHLEEGKIYTISGNLLSPTSGSNSKIRTNATVGSGSNSLIININGAGEEWSTFETTFYASETGEYNLRLQFNKTDESFGLFADNIKLSEENCILSGMEIKGQSEIRIPASESITEKYYPVMYSSDGKEIHLLMSDAVYVETILPEGTSFNKRDMSLTVFPEASIHDKITISCSLQNSNLIAPASLTITLRDNLLDDDITKEGILQSESPIEIIEENGEKYISLNANNYTSSGYSASLSYGASVVLIENVMYVLRARIKSDSPERAYSLYAKNTTESFDGTVNFNITDITGGKWINVTAAFIPDASGIYNIALNLHSPYDCKYSISEISLRAETEKAEYITIHAPGNVAIPDTETSFPVNAYVRDQMGNIMPDEKCNISLLNSSDSLLLDADSSFITIMPDALEGEYMIRAVSADNPSVSSDFPITVSHDYIGDGGFENKVVNEWWMTSSPYNTTFKIRDDGNKYADIKCDGNYFILFNNSYLHLIDNTPYAFTGNLSSDKDCIVTVFIETFDKNTSPLVQFTLKAGSTPDKGIIPELFLSEGNNIGRILIYFESLSGDPFSIKADNFHLKKAIIKATSPEISGNLHVNGSGKADFIMYNNIAGNTDSSASVINWYVSDSPTENYTPLDTSGKYLYFDITFENKYVYFDVTPVCPLTGFSGMKIKSKPVLIVSEGSSSGAPDSYIPPLNKEDNIESEPDFVPVKLSSDTGGKFIDTTNHWALREINILSNSNVIKGKTPDMFYPEDTLLRCEASALFQRAFNVSQSVNKNTFEDVYPSDWFYSPVVSLSNYGIINGTDNRHFSPYNKITREEFTVLAMRIYHKLVSEKRDLSSFRFNDDSTIHSWAREDIYEAVILGIISGSNDGCFYPDSFITRAESAKIILKLLEVIQN